MVHIKTVLAATCAILKNILQLDEWSKGNVLYSKRTLCESSFQKKKELTHLEFCGERVMIKWVSKGQSYREYEKQRFQVMLWQFWHRFYDSFAPKCGWITCLLMLTLW